MIFAVSAAVGLIASLFSCLLPRERTVALEGDEDEVTLRQFLLVQPLAGHLADKIDIAKTVFVGLLLAALAISTVTFTARVPLIAVLIIAGVGIGTVWTNSDALVSTLATKGQLSASIGAAQSFKKFGDVVGRLRRAEKLR